MRGVNIPRHGRNWMLNYPPLGARSEVLENGPCIIIEGRDKNGSARSDTLN